MSIATASVNGGTERVRHGDLIQFNGSTGQLITAAVTKFERLRGTMYLTLDGTYVVEAYLVRRAVPVAVIHPGSHVTIQCDILDHGDLPLTAGTTLEVLAWREGMAAVTDKDKRLIRVPMLSLIQAAWPTISDVRLVYWERSRP